MMDKIRHNLSMYHQNLSSDESTNKIFTQGLPFLSFSGGGFLGIYHLGVVACFEEMAPYLTKCHCVGVSAGAMAATVCALLPKMSLLGSIEKLLENTLAANANSIGALHYSYNVAERVKQSCTEMIPDDLKEKDFERITISVSKYESLKMRNVLLANIKSKKELVDAICCSSFIPIFSGVSVPSFRGKKYYDGGLSNNKPSIGSRTVTISPIAGDGLISPGSNSYFELLTANNMSIPLSLKTVVEFSKALVAPSFVDMVNLFKSGYKECFRYLATHVVPMCSRHCKMYKSSFKYFDFRVCRTCHNCKQLYSIDPENIKLSCTLENFFYDFEKKVTANNNRLNGSLAYRSVKYMISCFSFPLSFGYHVLKNGESLPCASFWVGSKLYDMVSKTLFHNYHASIETDMIEDEDEPGDVNHNETFLNETLTFTKFYHSFGFSKERVICKDGIIMSYGKNLDTNKDYKFNPTPFYRTSNAFKSLLVCLNDCQECSEGQYGYKSKLYRSDYFYDQQSYFLNSIQNIPYLEMNQDGEMANVIHVQNQINDMRKAFYRGVKCNNLKLYSLDDPVGPPPAENVMTLF